MSELTAHEVFEAENDLTLLRSKSDQRYGKCPFCQKFIGLHEHFRRCKAYNPILKKSNDVRTNLPAGVLSPASEQFFMDISKF